MEKNKAYKVLAEQEKISNGEAKKLIDRGLVFLKGKKVNIARAEVPIDTKFRVKKLEKPQVLFEDEKMIVLNKPAFINSEELERVFQGTFLLHRLDRETSGVLLLGKDRDFQKEVIETFKKREVYKEYVAWVSGKLIEPVEISKRIAKEKKGGKVRSVISRKGEEALTKVEPILVSGKRSKVKIVIETGRTHQIRVHLSSIGHSIIGDEVYGGEQFERTLLHHKKIELLGKSFEAPEPSLFKRFEN